MPLRDRRANRSSALLAATAALLLVLTGCTATTAPDTNAQVSPVTADELLAPLNLDGLDTRAVIDALEALPVADRPADLFASVLADEVIISDDTGREAAMPLPADEFYTSVAPYMSQTHPCSFHSLTTCRGELAGTEVQITVTDAAGGVILDEERTTNDNGFVGLWLPRDLEGTITVTYDGKTATAPLSTGAEALTCLTTLQLA